jgi:hypothetical protein
MFSKSTGDPHANDSWDCFSQVILNILHSKVSKNILLCVDNFILIHPVKGSASATLSLATATHNVFISLLRDVLGLPIHEIRGPVSEVGFGNDPPCLGWAVSMSSFHIGVTSVRRTNMVRIISGFHSSGLMTRSDWNSLCGLLQFLSIIANPIRPALAAFYAERSKMVFTRSLSISPKTKSLLLVCISILRSWPGLTKLFDITFSGQFDPSPLRWLGSSKPVYHLMVDARIPGKERSGWGGGGCVLESGRYLLYQWSCDDLILAGSCKSPQNPAIPYLELRNAVHCFIAAAFAHPKIKRWVVLCDCLPAVRVLHSLFSKSPAMHSIARKFPLFLLHVLPDVALHVIHVPRDRIQLADDLSNGDVQAATTTARDMGITISSPLRPLHSQTQSWLWGPDPCSVVEFLSRLDGTGSHI